MATLRAFFLFIIVWGYIGFSYAQTTFTYDATGNRLAKVVAGNNGGQPCPVTKSGGRLAASETDSLSALLLQPNPSSGQVTIYFRLNQQEAATLLVLTSFGIEVHHQTIIGTGNNQSERIDLNKSAAGIYLVRLKRTSGAVLSCKLLLTD